MAQRRKACALWPGSGSWSAPVRGGTLLRTVACRLGAEVIKIEPREATRHASTVRFGAKGRARAESALRSSQHEQARRHIDWSARGQELFRELVDTPTPSSETSAGPPGWLGSLRCPFETEPALVLTSITPFGQDGPYVTTGPPHHLFNATEGGRPPGIRMAPHRRRRVLGEYDAGLLPAWPPSPRCSRRRSPAKASMSMSRSSRRSWRFNGSMSSSAESRPRARLSADVPYRGRSLQDGTS